MIKLLTAGLVVLVLLCPVQAQDDKGPVRIVVAGIANKTGDETLDWVQCGLRAELTRRLLRVKELVIMNVPAYKRAVDDLGLINKDLSDPDEAVKVAKALAADKFVVGRYSKAPTGVEVSLSLVDTKTGKAGSPVTRTGPPISVTAGLALDVAKALNAKADESAVSKGLTSSADAFEKYCKALLYKEAAENSDTEELEKENFGKATEHFIQATKDDEKFAAPYFELGWLFVRAEPPMYRFAEKKYKQAIELYPDYVEAHNNLGVVYERQGDARSAATAYLKALSISPNCADAHFNLARLYDSQKEYDKAIAEYEKTAKLTPADALVHNNLAVAKLNKGDTDGALKSYKDALDIRPDMKEAHLGLGLIYDSKNEKFRAKRHYQKYVDLGGDDEDILERLEQLKAQDQ
jgi:Flp pilus assembly protein TadD/TolB-like protein